MTRRAATVPLQPLGKHWRSGYARGMTEKPTDSKTPPPPKKPETNPIAGGIFIPFALLIGVILGMIFGQISVGMVGGLLFGLLVALLVWVYDRRSK